MSKIQQSIEKLLEKYRILTWYDGEQAFTDEYEALELTDAVKLKVEDNEFELKVRMLKTEPEQKFLLYTDRERPANEDNWLLDIELANHVFHTDKEALYLQEAGLGYHYKKWMSTHTDFFRSKERLAAFQEIANEEDGDRMLSLKLLQVTFGAETLSLDLMLRRYASAWITEQHESIGRDLERFGLKEIFWGEVAGRFGYSDENPSIYDFLLEAFQKNFSPTENRTTVNQETGIMLSVWQDTLSFQDDFKAISARIQNDLKIEEVLNDASIDEIKTDDLFELIDQRIISELVHSTVEGSLDKDRLGSLIKQRESCYWYSKYEDFYRTLKTGYMLLETIRSGEKITISDFENGIEQYAGKWFRIDQGYRLFIQFYRQANQNNVLSRLYEHVNKAYSNTWLLTQAEAWQKCIDKNGIDSKNPLSQTRFFNRHVQPYIRENKRLFVIISDALRYECGVSLHHNLLKENRFESSIEHQIAPVPSYTQLGMAALLPHAELAFNSSDGILADGKSTKGLNARKTVLGQNSGIAATAVLAEDLMKVSTKSDEARKLVSENRLVYIYHNRIDKTGDDKTSEEKVIEAARDEVSFLVDLIKKVANMGGNNIIVTSDHGFIYQNDVIDESDFADAGIGGDVVKLNRRFVLGRNLTHNTNMMSFSSDDLGIKGDVQVLIPKGINRLRVQGAGSRFVHGGASLQELVTPVVKVNKKREDTVTKVDVDVLNKGSNKISTNIQRVSFYQMKPAGEQTLGRSLKIQFRAKNGESLSDVFSYTFDSVSDTAGEREVVHNFQLSARASAAYKNQEIELVLEEQLEGSNKWLEYKKYPYEVRITFTNDFDEI